MLDAAISASAAPPVVPTGLPSLDRALGGGLPSTGLVALSACPHGRQTSIATGIAVGAARSSGRPAFYLSWHQPPGRVLDVVVAQELGLPIHRVHGDQLTDSEFHRARLLLQGLGDDLSFVDAQPPSDEQGLRDVLTGPPSGIHVLDRLDDIWNIYDEEGDGDGAPPRPGGFCTGAALRGLLARVHGTGSLVIAIVNATWPPDMPYPTDPAPVTMWRDVERLADVHLRFGPPPPGGIGRMQFDARVGGRSRPGTLFVDYRSRLLRWS